MPIVWLEVAPIDKRIDLPRVNLDLHHLPAKFFPGWNWSVSASCRHSRLDVSCCEQYKYTSPPPPPAAACASATWSDIALQIAQGISDAGSANILKSIFVDKALAFSCVVQSPSQPLPEDIQSNIVRYLTEKDDSELDDLYSALDASVSYAYEYGIANIPNYTVLGSVWLAIAKEQSARKSEAWDRPVYALTTLLDGISDYDGQIRSSVFNNYTDVMLINGQYSWKRKSDGAIHSPSYSDRDKAIDVRVAELSNEAERAVEGNSSLSGLKKVASIWARLADRNPFVIPDANTEEIRGEVSFILKHLLTVAGISSNDIQSDPKRGLGATTWRSGEVSGTMLIVPGDWDLIAPKIASKIGGPTDYDNQPGERIVQGYAGSYPQQVTFEAFPRTGGGAYLISTSAGTNQKAVQDTDAKIRSAISAMRFIDLIPPTILLLNNLR